MPSALPTPRFATFSLIALALAGCGSKITPVPEEAAAEPGVVHQAASEGCCAGDVYRARATAYYPAATRLEGGFVDRKGRPLHTLQDFIDGRADSVSVAMDANALPYGARVCIPELNAYYGMSIPFRVVDTGGAFRNKGKSRIDICVRGRADSVHENLNRTLEIIACDR